MAERRTPSTGARSENASPPAGEAPAAATPTVRSSRKVAVVSEAPKRAAHRPSRRSHIISSALSLFVRSPYDDVKVADIAALADLTPAAVHYHFDGKEQILLEAMREFSEELLTRAHEGLDGGLGANALMTALLGFVRSKRTAATVFFVTATGLSLSFEAHRKLVRIELAELFANAVRTDEKKRPAAEAEVIGAALVSVLEVAAITTLRGDDVSRVLGSRRLLDVVADLTDRVLG
jgi:AcrR family transcriptional regulator